MWAAEAVHMPMPDYFCVGTEEILLCSQNLEGWRNTVERKLRLLDKFKCYSDLQGIITEHEFITLLQEREISTFLLIMFVYHF